MMRRRAPLDSDRVMSWLISIVLVALAVQIAAVTAYVPLGIIGPDPARSVLLGWVMPTWIIIVTVVASLILRRIYRRAFPSPTVPRHD